MTPITLLLSLIACNGFDDANYELSGDTGAGSYGDQTASLEGDTASADDEECAGVSSEPVDVYLSADDSNSQAQAVIVRQLIEDGQRFSGSPRLYEFLNYYDFDFEAPASGEVGVEPQLRYDAETGSYSLLIGVVGHQVAAESRRPMNLTFSVDTSGSMGGHPFDRVQDVLRATAGSLTSGDIVSIVSWNDETNILLDGVQVSGPNDPRLLQAIESMATGGSTNLSQGLETAYQLASENFSEDRINRVVLLSDGGANTGVTDQELIARHADDGDGEGLYMLGIGMSEGGGYSDELMDTVTDVGKGAYLYIDSEEEAYAMFQGERFVANTEIAARDLQLRVTLPGGYLITEFHGEQMSTDPQEVDPQHLAPNDAMLYHQELSDCDAELHDGSETFTFHVSWDDPQTRERHETSITRSVSELLEGEQRELLKADAIVAYAEAIFEVGRDGEPRQIDDAQALIDRARAAAPSDSDLAEIDALLAAYEQTL